ncbi:C6 finger domain protein, partial [Metarhizium hybridum]
MPAMRQAEDQASIATDECRPQCQGGSPCHHCTRTGKTCEPQMPATSSDSFQFVAYESTRRTTPKLALPAAVNDREGTYLGHFVAVIRNCHFTARFPLAATALLPVMRGHDHLSHVAVALGALDAHRRAQVGTSPDYPSPRTVAFTRYQRALASLQDELGSSDAPQRDDVLWTTFLLGLFELMAEPSGDRWTRHMLYGTGRMLQLSNMSRGASPLKQMLFDAFQVLEANRAIMYGVETFLSENRWTVVRKTLFLRAGQCAGLPMDDMITLMLYTASFSQSFFARIQQIPEPERCTHPSIGELGRQGIHVQGLLNTWYLQHGSALHSKSTAHECRLALIYYHTLLLFLSRNYTYYPCWAGKATPLLSHSAISDHARSIVALIDQLLQSSNVPGVMLLFPLRVVGSLLTETEARMGVVAQLNTIYWKGYVVADRVKVDLHDLWAFSGLPGY